MHHNDGRPVRRVLLHRALAGDRQLAHIQSDNFTVIEGDGVAVQVDGELLARLVHRGAIGGEISQNGDGGAALRAVYRGGQGGIRLAAHHCDGRVKGHVKGGKAGRIEEDLACSISAIDQLALVIDLHIGLLFADIQLDTEGLAVGGGDSVTVFIQQLDVVGIGGRAGADGNYAVCLGGDLQRIVAGGQGTCGRDQSCCSIIRKICNFCRINGLSDIGHDHLIQIVGGHVGVLIILVAGAVALHGVLLGVHGDGDAVNGHALIVVAGLIQHMTLDGELLALPLSQRHIGAQLDAVHGPFDDLVQLGVALDAGDDYLVLQRQIALVHDAELRQLIGAARLPQDLRALSGDLALHQELQGLALGAHPFAVIVLHLQGHIQPAGLDLADGGGGAVGEPREGGADKHGHAHDQRQKAGQQ